MSKRNTARKRLRLEQLEERRLLAVLGHFGGDHPRLSDAHSGFDRPDRSEFFDSGHNMPSAGGRGYVRAADDDSASVDRGVRDRPDHGPRNHHEHRGQRRTPKGEPNSRPAIPADTLATQILPAPVAPSATPVVPEFTSRLRSPVAPPIGPQAPEFRPPSGSLTITSPLGGDPLRFQTSLPTPTNRSAQPVAQQPVREIATETTAQTAPVATVSPVPTVTRVETPAVVPRPASAVLTVSPQAAGTNNRLSRPQDIVANFSSLTIGESDESRESESEENDTQAFGGVINIENQPDLEDTLPLTKLETRSLLRDGSADDNATDEEIAGEEFGLELFRSDASDDVVDNDDVAEQKIASPQDASDVTTTEAASDPKVESNDLAFADYENIEAYGGLIELAEDLMLDTNLDSNPSQEEDFVDAALEVDTIIGQAPLLELGDTPAEGVKAADSVTVNRQAAGAIIATMAMLPRREFDNREGSSLYWL